MSSPDPSPLPGTAEYLRNPLPPGPGVCAVCRGPCDTPFDRCFPCHDHRRRSGNTLADQVFFISYAVKSTAAAGPTAGPHQHYDDLKRYKNPPVTPLAGARLRDLARGFVARHRPCLEAALGGRITDLAVVPSARRPGDHPLARLLHIHNRVIDASAEPSVESGRRFAPGRFAVRWSPGATPARVLLLDDTWTTGASVQSFANAIKAAGAVAVVAVILGRLLNSEYPPSRPILTEIRDRRFDPSRCTSPSCGAPPHR